MRGVGPRTAIGQYLRRAGLFALRRRRGRENHELAAISNSYNEEVFFAATCRRPTIAWSADGGVARQIWVLRSRAESDCLESAVWTGRVAQFVVEYVFV